MRRKLSIILSLVLLFSVIFSSSLLAESVYKVKSGDVLWKIARQYGMSYQDLADYNDLKNPHLIYAGQELKIPTAEELAAKKGGESTTDNDSTEVVAKDTVTITILGTSDLHGRIYPYEYAIDEEDADAGLAKISTLVKEQRKLNKNTILIDCGDTTQDNSIELFNKDEVSPMIKALNLMNYDVWTIGNHEFNFEKSFLEGNIKNFKGTSLSANILKTDGSYFVKPYTIITKDGVRVAIVGLTPPAIPKWEAGAPEHFEGLTFPGTLDSTKKVLAELKGKYDVLIGAFHLGEEGEHGYEGAADIANACPEFDAIIMGHAHTRADSKLINGVTMIEPGAYGWALSKIEVAVAKKEGKFAVQSVKAENLQTKQVEADPEILKAFKYVHDKSLADANEVIGKVADTYIKRVDYITGQDKVTTMPTSQLEDNAVIDLINEVQAYYAKADVSSAAVFKFDQNLVKGDFKRKDVANIYKYPNTLMGVNISGANLKKYMEWSASYYNQYVPGDVTVSFNQNIRGYNYDMFSGVKYDIDISKPAGKRITNLTFNGKPIDDAKTYKLAVNNYRFGTLTGLELVTADDVYYDSYGQLQDDGRIRALIVKYIQEQLAGVATPKVDNNWKIVGNSYDGPLKEEALKLVKDGTVQIPTSEDGRTLNVKSVNVYDLVAQGLLKGYKELTILHTNDMHGFFLEGKYDGMGAAKLATFFKQTKKENPNTLVLDAGDAIQGSNLVTLSDGENAIKIMNAMGYDAMAAGNHEFDYGKEQLDKIVKLANFPILAANITYKKDNSAYLEDYIIKEIDGIKVAIFGLETPETTYKSHPDSTKDLKIEDPLVAAKRLVPELRKKADIVIALVHLGDEGDYSSVRLAKGIEVDLIIDGHSHSTYPYGMKAGNCLIVSAGEKTKNAGVVKMLVKDNRVVSTGASLFTKSMSADITDDPAVKAIVDQVAAENKVIEQQVVGKTPVVLDGEREDVRAHDTNLGNLITDALIDISKADIALQNGGGIRASIDVGDITKGEILTVLPFGNTVRVVEISGKDVKAMIENGVKQAPELSGGFCHLGGKGGIMVEYDSSKPAGARVISAKVGGKEIDPAKMYTVATNDFLVAGGDDYAMLKGAKVVGEYGALDEVLIDYIKANGVTTEKAEVRIKDIAKVTALLGYRWAA